MRLAQQQLRLEREEILLVLTDVGLHLRCAVRTGERVGVVLGWQQHHPHVHALLEDHVDAPQRGMDARRVAVVDHGDVAREPIEQADLLRRERGARRRNHVLDPCLVHRNHIGVALDHDGEVLLLDRFFGEVKSVELPFLAVNLALGGVLVLGHRLVGA